MPVSAMVCALHDNQLPRRKADVACSFGVGMGLCMHQCIGLRRWRVWERQLRAIGCWAVFFVMLAFYLPVVTAIQALLQVRACPSRC